jgi:hypothetical protein
MVMQVLVIAVQNAVDYKDLGVATSGATLFRFIGGSVGTAALGAVFSARLASSLQRVMPAGSAPVAGAGLSLEALAALPAATRAAYATAFASATQTVFTIAAVVAVIGAILALFLPEKPLRATVAARASQVGEEMGEAFAMPVSAEAIDQLLGGLRIIADRDVQRRFIERVVARAGLSLSPLAAWLLLRIERDGHAHPRTLAQTHRMDEARIEAGIRELRGQGLVAGPETPSGHVGLGLTSSGCEALEKLIAARRVRLEELAVEWPEDRRAEVSARLRELAAELIPPRRVA